MIAAAFITISVLTFAASAEAQNAATLADAAETAYVELNYEPCIEAANASIQREGDAEARVRAFKFRGLCQAALSDVDSARESFEAMLAIDLKAKLPEGLSPRFTSSYFEAKGRWIGREPIALTIDSETTADGIRTLTLSLKDDAELIRSVAWRGPSKAIFDKVKAAEKLQFEVPEEDAVDVVALDKGGAVLRVVALSQPDAPDAVPLVATPTEATASETDEGIGLPVIIGGSVVGAVVAVAVASAAAGGLYYLSRQSVDATPAVAFSGDLEQ